MGNLLSGKGTVRAREGIVRAGYGSSIKKEALFSPHHLTNFTNLANVINLDEYTDLDKYADVIYFDSFGVEHFSKEIKKFPGHKNIKTNIFRIQAGNSIMCG